MSESDVSKVIDTIDILNMATSGTDTVMYLGRLTEHEIVGERFADAMYWVSLKLEKDIKDAVEKLDEVVRNNGTKNRCRNAENC